MVLGSDYKVLLSFRTALLLPTWAELSLVLCGVRVLSDVDVFVNTLASEVLSSPVRDGTHELRVDANIACVRGRARESREAGSFLLLESVSYTHLTLPTIYSV